jgi:hypothetical protein
VPPEDVAPRPRPCVGQTPCSNEVIRPMGLVAVHPPWLGPLRYWPGMRVISMSTSLSNRATSTVALAGGFSEK